ncbi:hypothetical protein DY000_02006755 [Brassica cretica]|uniref:Uncharacterized protein n=1 Tax=Brassica cretica TaxID=69181 RepID=A0ABQ7C777_BRACR|nr:hypothetical protein DY000_02006755 [Brassica cretica]
MTDGPTVCQGSGALQDGLTGNPAKVTKNAISSGSIRQPVSASGRRPTSKKTQPEPNRQTSPCAGQRHQTSRSAGETSHDTARELEPSHALEEDDGNGESNANTGVALVWRGSQM